MNVGKNADQPASRVPALIVSVHAVPIPTPTPEVANLSFSRPVCHKQLLADQTCRFIVSGENKQPTVEDNVTVGPIRLRADSRTIKEETSRCGTRSETGVPF